MIYRDAQYGEVKNVIVAEFGNGTLSVTNGSNAGDGHLSLLMKSNKATPIGDVTGSEKNSNEFSPELALVFWNKESFEVFYSYVENIRKEFNLMDSK